jgi:ubiquinone/menaquinone biosynthesis C-methylase UbiE
MTRHPAVHESAIGDWDRHLHCGFWEAPAGADAAGHDLAAAGEEMCRHLFAAAEIAPGMRILDAGCGTGGTCAALDAAFDGLSLTGVNIDVRELALARRRLRTSRASAVEWIEGDACAMPLPDGDFDLVLAVETIMFFRSRRRFFAEARRVLRPGGALLVVDFLPAAPLRAALAVWDRTLGRLCALIYPQTNLRGSVAAYRRIAAATGFRLVRALDWTRHTLPTYPAARRILRRINGAGFRASAIQVANAATEGLCRAGLLRYQVLLFRDTRAPVR